MALLIGMDEAGLGPNIGPYVVTATVWEVPDPPDRCDLWDAFADVATSSPSEGDERLHIGDSKAVFQPSKGLASLERGVLAALGMLPTWDATTDRRLRRQLSCDGDDRTEDDPWYTDDDLPIPHACDPAELSDRVANWQAVARRTGIQLRDVRSAIIEPAVFNELIEIYHNKAEALSTVSLKLLKFVTQRADDQPALACCDKHGGRNFYAGLLSECFDGEFVIRVKESAERSVYRLGHLEVRFEPRAECHFPVALASMVSKYVRELAMRRFNQFWSARIPNLRPTQGYPVDARRFHDEIRSEQRRLTIPDHRLWRCR